MFCACHNCCPLEDCHSPNIGLLPVPFSLKTGNKLLFGECEIAGSALVDLSADRQKLVLHVAFWAFVTYVAKMLAFK